MKFDEFVENQPERRLLPERLRPSRQVEQRRVRTRYGNDEPPNDGRYSPKGPERLPGILYRVTEAQEMDGVRQRTAHPRGTCSKSFDRKAETAEGQPHR